ncbi:MAG: damage-inducible protein DinB [Mucilaginibacter sp.]|nr:damage-inducible protein DinB [Mucilaginibacter sp.]
MNNKPKPDEFSPFHTNYINLVGNEPILDILEQLKESTYSFLTCIDADKADYAYAEGKWTLKEVLGHMIDAERTFAYRILAFSRGQKELPGFDENAYVENATFGSRRFKDLATEFRLVRESNLYLFRSLSSQQLITTGISDGNKISVRALLYIAAGHELHHLNIIKEKYLS